MVENEIKLETLSSQTRNAFPLIENDVLLDGILIADGKNLFKRKGCAAAGGSTVEKNIEVKSNNFPLLFDHTLKLPSV